MAILRGAEGGALSLTELVKTSAREQSALVDTPFVEALSELLADLTERGVLVGSRQPGEMTMISVNDALRCAPLCLLFALFACRKDEPVAARSEVPVVASATPLQKRFSITSGGADFLIDAPLEKIKGHSGKVRGAVDLDFNDLKASKGTIEVDLDDFANADFRRPQQEQESDRARPQLARNRL